MMPGSYSFNNLPPLPPKPPAKNLILKRRKFLIVAAAFALLGATLLAQSYAATGSGRKQGTANGGQPATTNKPPTTCDSSAYAPPASLVGYRLTNCEDFNGTGMPQGWSAYDGGSEGAVGVGYTPKQCSFGGGLAELAQESDGATCGLRSNFSQKYGYWEVRMRAVSAGDNGSAPYPQLILRPTDSRIYMNQLQYFGADVGQSKFEANFTCSGNPAISCFRISHDSNTSQWHTYGLEWTAAGFNGYMDGQRIYTDPANGIAPDTGMNQAIQLGNLSRLTPAKPAKMEVDWVHVYGK
jgi:hypothetical protein